MIDDERFLPNRVEILIFMATGFLGDKSVR